MTDQPSEPLFSATFSGFDQNSTQALVGTQDTLADHLTRASELAPGDAALTFVDFAADFTGRRRTLTWAELDRRVSEVAADLVATGASGRRVAIVAPQGPEYVVGFLGALRAGAIAVPLPSPSLPGHRERLSSALNNSGPDCLLTTSSAKDAVADLCSARRFPGAGRIMAIDEPDAQVWRQGLGYDEVPVGRAPRTARICSTPRDRRAPRKASKSRTPTSSPTSGRRWRPSGSAGTAIRSSRGYRSSTTWAWSWRSPSRSWRPSIRSSWTRWRSYSTRRAGCTCWPIIREPSPRHRISRTTTRCGGYRSRTGPASPSTTSL